MFVDLLQKCQIGAASRSRRAGLFWSKASELAGLLSCGERFPSQLGSKFYEKKQAMHAPLCNQNISYYLHTQCCVRVFMRILSTYRNQLCESYLKYSEVHGVCVQRHGRLEIAEIAERVKITVTLLKIQ